jgi:hypothetical protein
MIWSDANVSTLTNIISESVNISMVRIRNAMRAAPSLGRYSTFLRRPM